MQMREDQREDPFKTDGIINMNDSFVLTSILGSTHSCVTNNSDAGLILTSCVSGCTFLKLMFKNMNINTVTIIDVMTVTVKFLKFFILSILPYLF